MPTPVFVRVLPINPGTDTDTLTDTFDASGCDFVKISVLRGYPNNTTITSCVYNSVSATLNASAGPGPDNQAQCDLFYVLAPASGSHTVTVVLSGTSDRWAVVVEGFSGVDQGTPLGTPVTTSQSNDASITTTVTAVVGDLVIDCMCFGDFGGGTLAAAVGQTETANIIAGDIIAGCSYVTAGSTSVAMTWNGAGDGFNGAQIAVALKGASGGPAPAEDAPWTFYSPLAPPPGADDVYAVIWS